MKDTDYLKRKEFMRTYSQGLQRYINPNTEKSFYFGTAPTLAEVTKEYGEDTAKEWLRVQLCILFKFFNRHKEITAESTTDCIRVILAEFYYLKVSELLLFFFRFRSLRYSRMYSFVTPVAVIAALREFLYERAVAYDHYYQKQQEEYERERREKEITWEQYCLDKYGEVRPHPLGQLKLKKIE